MDRWLKLFYVTVLGVMLWITISASIERGVFVALGELWPDLWFRATLADAYFAFLTVYFWVAWRERTWSARFVWLVLFLGLGSMAIAVYVLINLVRHGGIESMMRVTRSSETG